MEKTITHGNMVLTYDKEENACNMKKFMPGSNQNGFGGDFRLPNFSMTVAGHGYGLQEGVNSGGSCIPWQSVCAGFDFTEAGGTITYLHRELNLEVQVHMEFIPGADVIRQHNVVTNRGSEDVVLTHFSSMYLPGVACDGLLSWDDPDKYRIWFCHSTWQGECQWKCIGLEEAGMYSCCVHNNTNTFQVSSIGSWSTARFYPAIMLEDIETKQIWYAQIETSSSWHFEIGHRKQSEGEGGQLYIEADGADENTSGWARRLKPGQSFSTVPVAYGCTCGGFEQAVHQMTVYRRSCRKPAPAWQGRPPLMFNDYMNALWAEPDLEKLIPLIDAAAEAGAEGFCIDAGWFGPRDKNWGTMMGDWIPSPDRFGEKGLQGIVDYIRSKGMRAGFWIEFEGCCEGADFYEKPDAYFLLRHGKRVGGSRAMLDFRHPEVRAFMHGVFDRMIDMGFSFVKNDYNQSTALGDDKYTESAADGLLEHNRAVYSFLDELRERYPQLIIENCGGGGLRGDYGMASHCHFQNTSDQEIYWRYPSIFQGYLTNILPEQATIWSYPWPLLVGDAKKDIACLRTSDYTASMVDGEQTVFNMINGCCGNMLLSGHIDCADAFNMRLIKQGTSYYKKIQPWIEQSFPVFPIGLTPINRKAFTVVGLQVPSINKMLLYVWRTDAPEAEVEISLSQYFTCIKDVKIGYPATLGGVSYDVDREACTVKVHFTKERQARLFEIDYLL